MNNIGVLSDNVIIAMITFIILLLIKGFLSIIKLLNVDKMFFTKYETYLYYKEIIDTIIDSILFLFAVFLLFFRKNNSILIIILAILFLLKGVFQYLIDLKLYTYTNLSNTTIDKLKELKHPVSFITNIVVFIASVYMLKIIFTNK
jgi:uncharacterized membrane protein HdeD (DUF308 family)